MFKCSVHPKFAFIQSHCIQNHFPKVKTLERTGIVTIHHPHFVITPTELGLVPPPQQMLPPPLQVAVVTMVLTIIIMYTRCQLLPTITTIIHRLPV